MDMEIVKKILRETVEKLQEDCIYPEEILDTTSNLKPSESFLKVIGNAFGLFCRKRKPRCDAIHVLWGNN